MPLPRNLVYSHYMYDEYDMVCVLGPTASGKTRYAVDLARRMGAEILSADSRQVYRGMDIGTGKDLDEYGDVPYHLIDIAEAGEKYDIYRYQHDFEKAYRDILSRGRRAILCGGSGLYIEAVCRGYNLPDVPPDPVLRAELEQYDDQTLIDRLAGLKHLHNTTDYDTRRRLIRALEIAIYEQKHPAGHTAFLPRKTKYIGMNVSRDERRQRIETRLRQRLQGGLVEEIEGLLAYGTAPEDLIYYGLEYKYVTRYVIGEISYEEMFDKLLTAIRQFAKRQMTWFRGMERRGIEIEWVDPIPS